MNLAPGTRLASYEIVAFLGAGGMGEVYRARDARLHRDVAIKVLPAVFAADRDRRARFEREARAIAGLSHPNILAVHDVGEADGHVFFVTELLEGQSLREWLSSFTRGGAAGVAAPPVRKAVDVGGQIARGLAAAHDKDVVHRDLKPENVFLLRDGRIKILDFGLARVGAQGGTAETASALTDAGVVMGTVGYMAPEQVRAQAVDARTDLFALGAVLYEMLSGARAFSRDTSAETMTAILRDDPPDLSLARPEVSASLDRVVRHCLEKNPAERFQTARDVAFALEAFTGSAASGGSAVMAPTTPARPPARRSTFAAGALGLIVLAGLAGIAVDRRILTKARPPAVFTTRTFQDRFVIRARLMPDGRSLVYAAFDGPVLDVLLLGPDSNEPRRIATNEGLLSVSSKGELALSGGFGSGVVQRSRWAWSGTLSRMSIDGAPRAVLEDVQDADWLPDGDSLAVVHVVDGRDRIEFPIGTALYASPGDILFLRVSPKGDRVAFFDHATHDEHAVLKVLDRSGRVLTLSDEYAKDWGLAWTPDGESVVFSADEPGLRRGYGTMFSVRAAAGARPRRLQQSAGGLIAFDIGAQGTLVAGHDEFRFGLMVMPPRATVERELNASEQPELPVISHDGSAVLFTEPSPTTHGDVVSLKRIDGSPAQRLGDGESIGLSPDNRWALVFGASDGSVTVLPTGAGSPSRLPNGPIEHHLPAGGWRSDSRHVVVCGNEASKAARCYTQDREGGPPRAITPEGVVAASVSPDGRVLVTETADQAWHSVGLDDGVQRPLPGLTAVDRVAGWSADGRSLFVMIPSPSPGRLERVDLATGARAPVKDLAPPNPGDVQLVYMLSFADDGRSYAYEYMRARSTLYLVEGFDIRP